jgi:4-hydroxy-tetrahydrodipicolinate reductase
MGAGGRMGRALVVALSDHGSLHLAEALDVAGSLSLGVDAGALAGVAANGVLLSDDLARLSGVDVVIDFTSPGGTKATAERCLMTRTPLVVGTTGLPADVDTAIAALAAVAPVVHAPNYSVGVTVLNHLARQAAELLGADFDAELVEMHHRHKVDAPSGTAVRLAETVRVAKGFPPGAIVHGRSGQVGARPHQEIGVMTLRGGDVIGDHTVCFAGPGERLELSHRAQDRSLFARGAVRAAAWVLGKKPGRYTMEAVLGLGPTA